MGATANILAHWNDQTNEYRTEESCGWEWFSEDGDNWVTGDGVPVECDEFAAATITLAGGPRDGTIVQ